MKDTLKFYSHGKLLLTGEYLVLDGAKAVALPCKLGQSLIVEKTAEPNCKWQSFLKNNEFWQKVSFTKKDFVNQQYKNQFEKRLFQILYIIHQLKPEIFSNNYIFKTKLEFHKDWGLGTSSTLINNLSQWAKVNPYHLLEKTFGGSGYDIAAANLQSPFLYKRKKNKIQTSEFLINDNIKSFLYFIYLNQKQNSRDGIAKYKQKTIDKTSIASISQISEQIQEVDEINSFESLMKTHENIISKILGLENVQSKLFSDYKSGIVKSLGAWGGDFVLATAREQEDLNYFRERGFSVIYKYKDLVF